MSDQGNRKTAAKLPVSAHPAFPPIVALWFAALFGIGSLVLPVALYERTAEATGLASIVTAAQAPLGITARVLIALVAAALGAVAGVEIARKVVAAATPRRAPRRAAAMRPADAADAHADADDIKRPISAHEELGLDGFDAALPAVDALPPRRRALTVTEESAPSRFLDFAPLPGEGDPRDPDDHAALDLGDFAPIEPEPEPEPVPAPDREPQPSGQSSARFGSAGLSQPPRPGAERSLDMPVRTRTAEPEDTPMIHAPRADYDAPATPAAAISDEPDAAPTEHAAAPVAEPSPPAIAELVARFARALDVHRAAASAQVETPATAEFRDPAPATIAADDLIPAVPPIPFALRPIDFDAVDDSSEDSEDALPDLDLTAALSRAPRAFGAAAPIADESDDFDDGDEADAEAPYSSLLAIRYPAPPHETVRIEDEPAGHGAGDVIEPVVIFPGQAAAHSAPSVGEYGRPFDAPQQRFDALDRSDAPRGGQAAIRPHAGDTERALREALEKLQRMSGVA